MQDRPLQVFVQHIHAHLVSIHQAVTAGPCVNLSMARDGRDCRAAVYHYSLPTGAGQAAVALLFRGLHGTHYC